MLAELRVTELKKGDVIFDAADTKIYNIFSVYEGEVKTSDYGEKTVKKDLVLDIFSELCDGNFE